MKVSVISLKGVVFEGEAESFNANTKSGEITVLNNHRPLITVLEKGVAKIQTKGGERREVEISSGFLEVDDKNNLSVLID